MNEQIKKLAEQSGFHFTELHTHQIRLERFAELIRQDEREDLAVLAEEVGIHLAKAIRARSNHEQT
jgi:hypothetical protein